MAHGSVTDGFREALNGEMRATFHHAGKDEPGHGEGRACRQLSFMEDLKQAAQTALKTTTLGEGLNATDRGTNLWAVFDHYIDRVALACVNELTPKWAGRLAAYDVYIWDQCFAMEQSLRID